MAAQPYECVLKPIHSRTSHQDWRVAREKAPKAAINQTAFCNHQDEKPANFGVRMTVE